MSIVDNNVVTNRAYGQGTQRKIREEHIDHLSNKYYKQYIRDSNFANQAEEDAVLAASAVIINQQTIDTEIANAIATYESGGDPLHFEASPDNWQKNTPNYQTWDELAAPVTIDFLSRVDQLDLVYIESTIIRISNTDKTNLWGMTNPEVSDVNAAIQAAVNTKATLDTYSPFFIDGVKV